MAPPTKPPRGIKPTKETSGLLISVIRALSASETNEQREVEKAKLEKEYKRSDQRLDELISLHDQDLTEVMKIFSNLSERVTASREKIHAVKENLNACKQLLRCKRDELMNLWLEGIEHKHVLQLLNDIEKLREVPNQLSQLIDKKLYLHATQLFVSASSMGVGNLEEVEGLQEVRTETQFKEHQLHAKLLQEVKDYLYIESTKDIGLKRQGSSREFQRGIESRNSKQNKAKRNLLSQTPTQVYRLMSNLNTKNFEDIIKDESFNNNDEYSEQFLGVVIECLALLNRIPETVEVIKGQMQNELLNMIARSTNEVMQLKNDTGDAQNNLIFEEMIDLNTINSPMNQGLLFQLLQNIFCQFRAIATAHQEALKCFSLIIDKYSIDVSLYETADVWSSMQGALQLLLTDYLDIHNTVEGSLHPPANLNESTRDINSFFTRRKTQKQKSNPLFKFESTSHPVTLNNYFKEHRYSSFVAGDSSALLPKEKKLVCEPDPKNIILMFRPIMSFIEEMEKLLQINLKSPCTLNNFMTDYIKEVYLGMHHVLVATMIDSAIKNPDAWRTVTSAEVMKEFTLTGPLLQSTIMVHKCVAELRTLMIALPLQGEHFCTLALNVLHNYRETCQAVYRGIVQPDSEDKRICSAAWLKDDDISRFIKSLPNWTNLKHEISQFVGGYSRRLNHRQETQEEESPEDVRQRNLREAEILASNLGEGGINKHEILSDISQLKCLALLQESMEWFTLSIRRFVDGLRQANVLSHRQIPIMPTPLLESLDQVHQEFEELADKCILVLHLEVRVQCFHYLLPQGEYSHLCEGLSDTQEADPCVEDLSRVLQHIDEALSTLNPKKTKYIFEGLGHLIAKILITSAQYMKKIDDSGVQRMCRNVFTLQQTLTNITMTRELALDYARQYFEMFYETPDQILNNVLENGPQFSELEYINALQLISRSQADYSSISKHLEKLSEILGDVGVTV